MRLWVKILMVAAMTIAILVPLTMVRGVIHERQERRAEVVADVAASYGGRQVVSGPVLVVPYTENVREQVETVHRTLEDLGVDDRPGGASPPLCGSWLRDLRPRRLACPSFGHRSNGGSACLGDPWLSRTCRSLAP